MGIRFHNSNSASPYGRCLEGMIKAVFTVAMEACNVFSKYIKFSMIIQYWIHYELYRKCFKIYGSKPQKIRGKLEFQKYLLL